MLAATANDGPRSERDQTVLRRLAVFAGSFSLEAAEAVTVGRPVAAPGSALWRQAPDHLPPGFTRAAPVEALHALAQQHLLLREDGSTGAPRYRLSAPVREAEWAHLAATGELETVRRAHALYVLAFAEAIDRRVWTPEYPRWMAQLEEYRGDLDAALAWTIEAGAFDLGLRLAAALWLFWQTRGRVAEGRRWLAELLAPKDTLPWARAAALVVSGLLAWLQDDLDDAEEQAEEALMLWRAIDVPEGIARSLFNLALAKWRRGDGPGAMIHLDEAAALFRALNDLAGQPLCQIVTAILRRDAGESVQALALLEEAAGLAETGGFFWGAAAARYYEGEVRTDREDFIGAMMAYRATVSISVVLGDPWTTGAGIGGLATLAVLRGETERAARLFGASDVRCRAAGAFLPVIDRTTYDRIVDTARATLGEPVFAAAYAAGSALPTEAVIAEIDAFITRTSVDRSAVAAATAPPVIAAAVVRLAPRERDILNLLVEGRQDGEIAALLGLSPRTVSERVGMMFTKFGVPNRTSLAVSAVRRGLI